MPHLNLIGTPVAATIEAQDERPWLVASVRASISLVLSCCLFLVASRAIAQWHFRQGSPEELREAIAWNPRNAAFYAARAQALQMSVEGAEVNEVIRLREKATRLSPNHALYWAELGDSYEWSGNDEEARRAYERAQQQFPRSPRINWRMGNFCIRAGYTEEGMHALARTVRGDPGLWRPIFDLVWRAGVDPQRILDEVVPAEKAVRLRYLDYLAETQRLDAAAEVWRQLLASGAEIEVEAVFPYLDALIQQQRSAELGAAWNALLEERHLVAEESSFDGGLITNGSFESQILNGGLDWRVGRCEGVDVRVDTRIFFSGARSLRLDFDGTKNMDCAPVVQFVPVEPDAAYRLAAYTRSERVSSDTGPRLEVYDAGERSRLWVAGDALLGTASWSLQELQFKTGPETRVLVVSVARRASHSLDGRIAGAVWVDRVSLHRAE
ncbi:MAG TPA: tetratricopeptide repeat protein [Candidatus Acidoferrales bacterium]|nr:tetratricopeptide repeat protein [Candidatus Acidoferrales bacterium]